MAPDPISIDETTGHAVLRAGELTIDLIAHRAVRAGQPLRLRPRGLDILIYLVWNRQRMVTTAELREQVLALPFDPGTNSIAVHVAGLRAALDRGFSFPMIISEYGQGYGFAAQPAEELDDGE